MSEITMYLKSNLKIQEQFVDVFYDTLCNNTFIEFDDVREWIGYKKKETVHNILINKKYGFTEGTDYRIEKIKKDGICKPINEIYMSIDTIKCICLLCPTEKGHQFRKYYIEMEKLFRKYISTTIQNQLSNPIPQLNKYDFDINNYMKKEVLYLIYIKDDIYKFGVSADIKRRLSTHQNLLGYQYVIKCWDCINRTVSKQIEDDIKRYCKVKKINSIYEGQTEIIKTDKIDDIIIVFNEYVTKRVDEYEGSFKNKQLEQQIVLVTKMENLMNQIQQMNNDDMQKSMTNFVNSMGLPNNTANPNKSIPDQQDDTKEQNLIKEFEESIQYCRHCNKNKKLEEFGLNEKTNTHFKQCIQCREKCKIADKQRRNKHKEENINTPILHPQKQQYYNDNHDEIRQKQKQHYDENKSEIIEQKKKYVNKRIESVNNDPTKSYCRKCNVIKLNDEFGINNKSTEQYKQCISCRTKQNKILK